MDVGHEWLKAIRVARDDKALTLVAVELDRVDPARGVDPARLAALVRRVGGAGLPVVGCLARQFATIRTLDLPSTDPAELAAMVELQVGKLTPYSKDEIVTDHKIVGPAREGYTRVLLVIVQRSVLRNRFSLMEEAGVAIQSMSIGTEGVLQWVRKAFPAAGARGSVAILDVDAGASDCLVVAENQLLFTRSILVGAVQLQSDDTARERLIRDTSHALQAFGNETGAARPERVLVTGAGLYSAGLAAALQERLDIPVETVDCCSLFRKQPATLVLGEAPYNTVSLTPLVGMAIDPGLLECRLVPDSVRLRQELVGRARRLAALACLLVAVLLAFSLWGVVAMVMRQQRVDRIRAELDANRDTVRSIEHKQKLIDVIRLRHDPRHALVSVLADVHRTLPPPAQIVVDGIEFDADRQSLQLVGSGATQREVSDLVQALEASPLLIDVREDGSTVREANGRYRFRMVCRLEAPHAS